MFLRLLSLTALALLPCYPALAALPHNTVAVAVAKTSIYVGSVTLTTTTFTCEAGTTFAADYKARVVPYFFSSEQGKLWIDFSEEQFAQLARGERVHFTGRAQNSDNEERRIEGHATPAAPDSVEGKIKVRVFVSPKIELIFNTTYRLGGR